MSTQEGDGGGNKILSDCLFFLIPREMSRKLERDFFKRTKLKSLNSLREKNQRIWGVKRQTFNRLSSIQISVDLTESLPLSILFSMLVCWYQLLCELQCKLTERKIKISPKMGKGKNIWNHLITTIKSDEIQLQYWPLNHDLALIQNHSLILTFVTILSEKYVVSFW
jgi:hypothetical protein